MSRGALLDDVWHQLSQPMTALCGSLELALLWATTPEEYRRSIEEALEQADRLLTRAARFRKRYERKKGKGPGPQRRREGL